MFGAAGIAPDAGHGKGGAPGWAGEPGASWPAPAGPDASPRDRLLAAAHQVLADDGLEGLTLRAIARRAGVSHGAPLRHFPTLAALLSALAADGFVHLVATINGALAAADAAAEVRGAALPARTRLAVSGRAYLRFALTDPGVFSITFRPERVDVSDADYLTAAVAAFEQLVGLVAAAQAEGWFPEVPPNELAAVLWAHVHGLATLALHGSIGGVVEGEDAVQRLLDLSIFITVGPEGDPP